MRARRMDGMNGKECCAVLTVPYSTLLYREAKTKKNSQTLAPCATNTPRGWNGNGMTRKKREKREGRRGKKKRKEKKVGTEEEGEEDLSSFFLIYLFIYFFLLSISQLGLDCCGLRHVKEVKRKKETGERWVIEFILVRFNFLFYIPATATIT